MIASLCGRLEAIGQDGAIISAGGIGFRVLMPAGDLAQLGEPGREVKVYTHLHVRDDNIALYGFSTPEALWLFETLLGVTGLGPKLSLALLSTLSPEQIVTAITSGTAEMLDMVPGIGRKVADRIILELKGKIGAGWAFRTPMQADTANSDVLAVLTSLGYSASEALKAMSSLPRDPNLTLEEKVRLSLQYLGKR